MDWLILKNAKAVKLKDIPEYDIRSMREDIIAQCLAGKRIVSFYAAELKKVPYLFSVLADDDDSRLYVARASLSEVKSYPAITPEVPALHMFERELHEQTGIVPEGHPWLKPVRYSFDRADSKKAVEGHPFFPMEGESVHEVAVGPVHAGVIEPGHFRFMCHGETVYHLEIQLGYQHRGMENLLRSRNPLLLPRLAESIAGDTVIGHTACSANMVEALAGMEIPKRAQAIRGIAHELERAGVHIGDLGAICNDVAYMIGNAFFGARRTLVINTTLALCGSRFGRGLISFGGVQFDIDGELKEEMKKTLSKVGHDVELMSGAMLANPGVIARLEKTGIVDTETAQRIGMVGMAARASGISVDVRSDHPYGIYRSFPVHKITMKTGDVFARTYLRIAEISQSLRFISETLERLPEDGISVQPQPFMKEGFAVSMAEGWRGEIVHAGITDRAGNLVHYKVKDPSFQNWFGLALAVRDNGISDFPLCNKSFNLSYCGNDL